MTPKAMMITAERRRRTADVANDARAMIPPSPWLSALITMSTYFTDTISVRVQKTSDNAPNTRSSDMPRSWAPSKISEKA